MKTHLKNIIVPHEGNDYKPHLLRRTGVLVVLVCSLAVFTFGFLQRTLLFSPQMLATIYPNLVATLSNQNREEVKLPSLAYNDKLEEAARLKAEDMMIRGYFAHVSPDGIDPWHWIKQAGYSYEYAGENLAINFSDSSDVTRAWMESPGHRANILNSHFTEVGVATVKGYVGGRETVFVVQMFGSPSTQLPSSSQTIAKEVATSTSPASTSTPINISTASSSTSTPISLENNQEVLGLATTSKEGDIQAEKLVFAALSLVVSNPRMIVMALYVVLAVAILLSITLSLVFFKRHHIHHVLYGVLALVWIIACALAYVHYFGPKILIN